MSEEKKTAATEEVKEEARKLSEEELEKVNGGIKGMTVATTTIVTGGILCAATGSVDGAVRQR
ncbi:MAG: class IIb bacteriocin, lactobin A/cerein 7B family [Lachnospiraceae bacterium]|nr:class IIb bacteriocin, lactobin A/cerein 7B family [Lachnospiraceae bacterium]